MNHAYYISRLPQELKAQIEAETIYIPWIRYGMTLEEIWSNQATMESIYNQLSVRERKVLHILLTSIGCEPFDGAKLETLAAPAMSGAEAKVGFIQLLQKGLLYAFRKSWGEYVYVMAYEGLALWQRILFEDEAEMLRLPNEDNTAQDVHVTEEGGLGLAHAVFHSLVYFDQNEIKLTKNGTLHKRQLQKWIELLPLQKEKLEGCGIKYAYADIYPASIAVALDMMTRIQLLDQKGEELTLSKENVRVWLMLSEAEQSIRLYGFWKRVAFPKEVWLQHAVLLLERQPHDVWIRAEGILQWLRKYGILAKAAVTDNEALLRMLEDQWVQPLIAFGWLEKGSDDSLKQLSTLYRWKSQPLSPMVSSTENEQLLYVQPDFEVLVPPNVSFAVRWELSAIADYYESDPMSLYKLSKESMQRGLERGHNLDQTLTFLEQHAAYGVPDNVKLTLEQWAKPFGKARLIQALLLRCEDAGVANTIHKIAGAAECLEELIGDRTWIVRGEQLQRLTVLLDKAGWMPGKLAVIDSLSSNDSNTQKQRTNGSTNMGNGDLSSNEKGFIYSRQSYIYFEMEQRLPSIQDVYPDIKKVPASWMKEYRTYHPSTRREIVEKAMEWKTAIQLRQNGSDYIVAPRKLLETRGTWTMTGLEESNRQEVCLMAEDWQEMKIVLPGIDEKY
jgi:hypothetical protein